jgi:large subunit ribosomal protein L24
MSIPAPAVASLPAAQPDVSAEPSATDDVPIANAPVPKRDPRRVRARARSTVPRRPASQASSASALPWAGRLPLPIQIRPAPIPRPVSRQPLVQRPPASTARPAL